MKILVISCATGGGHNKCAEHIQKEFNLNNIRCDVKDFYEILNKKDYASKLYLKSLGQNGGAFKYVYKIGELYNKTPMKSPVYFINSFHKNVLEDYIKENEYDLVLCTHLFPALTLTAINKEEKHINFIFVSTDYECAPFNNEVNADYIVIPKGLQKRYLEKRISKKKLLPLGIPISSTFLKSASNIKSEFAKKNEKMILVLLGSMGFGNILEFIHDLCSIPNSKIVVVCGNNKDLYNELKKVGINNLIPLGYVDNVSSLIKSSDLVISKPGGLFSTEVAAVNKPLIHMFPIPGVETYNTHHFASKKMSLLCMNHDELLQKVQLILEDNKVKEKMLASQRKYIGSTSAVDLVDFILKHYNRK